VSGDGGLILGIDGALGSFSAALVGEGVQLAGRVERNAALERGLGLIGDLLGAAGTRLRDLAAIAVCTGPGGFTGLRIALSYAKALALGAGVPLTGVSSYDAVLPAEVGTPSIAIVSGRPGLVCARLQLAEGATACVLCGEIAPVTERLAAELAGAAPGPIACCGDAQGVAERLGERGFTVRAIPMPAHPALAVAEFAARRPREAFGSPHLIVADYGFPAARAPQDAAKP
jgi:tRNA threonylcarbamoyl adenosine modification protein YeaZ